MVTGKKLTGRIEGGYKAGEGEFFLLLVPAAGHYNEDIFQQDMDIIRVELRQLCPPSPRGEQWEQKDAAEALPVIDGVFLSNRDGEKADNALFRAFQELFSASSPPLQQKSTELLALEEIISGELIQPFYQPIFSLTDGSVHGHEALSRISRPGIFTNIEELFNKSDEYGLTSPLDMLCRKKALFRARELKIAGRLFLNICPEVLQGADHERGITAALLEMLQIHRSQVVFELTERTLIKDYMLFSEVISYYRNQGYSIAIDDLGTGYAGLEMLARLEPDYVKLARFLIAGIDTSSVKQALVEALVTFCNRIGAKVIAEGIERREELEYLMATGVLFGQGYLLAKPSPLPFPEGALPDNLQNIFPSAT
jgi:EAL domain-containing protein (putative c-di-GMP-specific phosphodiesterase class I)